MFIIFATFFQAENQQRPTLKNRPRDTGWQHCHPVSRGQVYLNSASSSDSRVVIQMLPLKFGVLLKCNLYFNTYIFFKYIFNKEKDSFSAD